MLNIICNNVVHNYYYSQHDADQLEAVQTHFWRITSIRSSYQYTSTSVLNLVIKHYCICRHSLQYNIVLLWFMTWYCAASSSSGVIINAHCPWSSSENTLTVCVRAERHFHHTLSISSVSAILAIVVTALYCVINILIIVCKQVKCDWRFSNNWWLSTFDVYSIYLEWYFMLLGKW